MKNYKQTASDVLRLVGGEKNVVQVEHCSTRLRFTLADTSKADAAALKKIFCSIAIPLLISGTEIALSID